jgi:hypothetical protein
MANLTRIALAAAAASLWLHDVAAQTATALAPQSRSSRCLQHRGCSRIPMPSMPAPSPSSPHWPTARSRFSPPAWRASWTRRARAARPPGRGQGTGPERYRRALSQEHRYGFGGHRSEFFYKIQYRANISDRLQSIMKLYNDEVHIIAPTEMARAASQYRQPSLAHRPQGVQGATGSPQSVPGSAG